MKTDKRARGTARTWHPSLEPLEDRCLLAAIYMDPLYGVSVTPNQVYGTGIAHGAPMNLLADVYQPVDIGNAPVLANRPAVVLQDGGAWTSAHKDSGDVTGVANYLAARGYTVISTDYRQGAPGIPNPLWPFVSPQWLVNPGPDAPVTAGGTMFGNEPWNGITTGTVYSAYPGITPIRAGIEDFALAINWVRTNSAALGIDPNRIAIAGGSAGGIDALLLQYNNNPINAAYRAQAVVALVSTMDGNEDRIQAGGPPVFLLNNQQDAVVPWSPAMSQRFVDVGIYREQWFQPSDPLYHGVDFNLDLDGENVYERVRDFLANHFAGGPIELPEESSVAGRHLFYNQSAFDGSDATLGAADDGAIATDKTAYLPGAGIAVFNSITSYSRGLNGIMVDLLGGGTHTAIGTSDFVFKVGNNNAPDTWTTAPAPSSIAVRTGAGISGSDRVEIAWASGAIANQWLEVQVLATANTGLAGPDVHFWGNRIGDSGTGTPATVFQTTSADAAQVFGNLSGSAAIDDLRDYNRSGTVSSADAVQAFNNLGTIVRINIGSGGPFAPEGPSLAESPTSPGLDSGLAFALAVSETVATIDRASPEPPRRSDRPAEAGADPARVAAAFEQWAADQPSSEGHAASDRPDSVSIVDSSDLCDEVIDELIPALV